MAGALRASPSRSGLGLAGLIAVAVLGALGPAMAEPAFPVLTGRIVDEAGLLSGEDRAAIKAQLEALEAASTDQLVVVTLKSLQGYPIEDFGYQLGRKWGIGQKGKDNGILLIVAPKERKVHIEVSDGLEGTLTDAVAKSIIESSIMPNFKANDIPTGIYRGADDIAQALSGEADNIKRRPPLLATPDCNGCREKISLQIAPQIARITGEGLSTKYFFEGLPANGIHFLFKSLGVVGLILLSAGLAVALRGLPWVEKFFVAGSIAFAFTTYPIATYLIFWIWLSSLFVFVRHRSAGRAANTSEHG